VSNEPKKTALWERAKGLWIKHEEIIRYLIVGGLTTGLNAVVYWVALLLLRGIPSDYQIANAIAFFIAVIFAYFANKKAVFRSQTSGKLDTAREAGSFFMMRLISYGVEVGLLELLIRVWHVDEMLAKIPVMTIIVVLNYVFSKLYIFRQPKEAAE